MMCHVDQYNQIRVPINQSNYLSDVRVPDFVKFEQHLPIPEFFFK